MKKDKKDSKIDYDFENDTLFVFPKSRIPKEYNISEHIDDFILDFDSNKNLIGIEILNASKVFKLTKIQLTNIVNWDFTIDINERIIKIDVNMKFEMRNKFTQNIFSIEKINEDMLSPTHANLAIC